MPSERSGYRYRAALAVILSTQRLSGTPSSETRRLGALLSSRQDHHRPIWPKKKQTVTCVN